jgi:hypothetical protein
VVREGVPKIQNSRIQLAHLAGDTTRLVTRSQRYRFTVVTSYEAEVTWKTDAPPPEPGILSPEPFLGK